MRKTLTTLVILASSWATAQAELPERAVVDRFGDGQQLELRPSPDGSPREYSVLALTRMAGVGQQLQPLGIRDTIVNTAQQTVELKPGVEESVTVNYVMQNVAYLRIEQTIRVRDGALYRNGQRVLTKSSANFNNLLWGVLWVTTGSLVSLFWIPSVEETQIHTEAIPVTPGSPAIRFVYGGGGDCFAFQGYWNEFWVDPGALIPGRVYSVRTQVYCAGTLMGVRGSARIQTAPLHVEYQAVGLSRDLRHWGTPPSLQFGRPVGTGQWVRGSFFGNAIIPGHRWEYDSAPTGRWIQDNRSDGWIPIEGTTIPAIPEWVHIASASQVDRLWSTVRETHPDGDYTGQTLFDQPSNYLRYSVCVQSNYPHGCSEYRHLVYRRTAASPPGPANLPTRPSISLEVAEVYTQTLTGPSGERVERLVVTPRPPAPIVVRLRDVFERVQ